MKFIFLQGAKRSGNHIFVLWLGELGGGLAHCNNYFYKIDEELDTADHGLQEPPFEAKLDEALNYIAQSGRAVGLISFEHPGRLDAAQATRILGAAKTRLQVGDCRHLHILRDPYNWMASFARMKAAVKIHGVDYRTRATFDQTRANYAVFHADYWQRWLSAYRQWAELPESSRVDYNRFVGFMDYRRALAARLGLAWDARIDARVAQSMPGQGSSFQANSVNIAGNVMERFEFALPLFSEFGIPSAVWQAGALAFPEVTQAIRLRLDADAG